MSIPACHKPNAQYSTINYDVISHTSKILEQEICSHIKQKYEKQGQKDCETEEIKTEVKSSKESTHFQIKHTALVRE